METTNLSIGEKMKKKILVVCAAGGAIQLESAAGALKAIDEKGALADAEISYMACSGGAPVAAMHASGLSGEDICNVIKSNPMSTLMSRPSFSRYMNAEGIYNLLTKHMPNTPIQNCRVALTRMNDGENPIAVMADATPSTVLASLSIQGVFQGVKIGEDIYGDGGAKNMIPSIPIGDIPKYDHIYFMVAPVDPTPPESFPFFDYEFKALFAIWDREITQFRENKWDELPNVTVIEPTVPVAARERGVLAELLDWSPNYAMIEEAYNYTKEKLNA